MKQFITEAKRFQELAGIINENEYNEGTLDFGPFKNVEFYGNQDGSVFLSAIDNDNFRNIENSLEYESDTLTDEEKDFLNTEADKLATEISDYLTSIGIENEIFDNPIGYGQEIDNLVVSIKKEDLSKLLN